MSIDALPPHDVVATFCILISFRKYSDEPYIGYYKLLRPAIVARDPDLIRDILITNFNCFRHNDLKLSKKHDPLTAINPFVATDEAWSEGRKIVLPVFSQTKVRRISFLC